MRISKIFLTFAVAKVIKMKQRTFIIKGKAGMQAHISTFGAKITKLIVPTANGEKRDVVLGFNTPEEWESQELYFNAVIGRVANRIKDGRFVLDGTPYQLAINNGTNALHGGPTGFNVRIWEVVEQSLHSLTLHYRAQDGEENFPGNLDVWVTYTLTKEGALAIRYKAKTDKPTIVGLTQHAYFNLKGEGHDTVRDHSLQVLANQYTPTDDTQCPTGEIAPVEGTPMDFRQPTLIGDRIDDPFFALGRGIDNNWVINEALEPSRKEPVLAAKVSVEDLTMEVYTTFPGLQVYTGNWVEQHKGKCGKMYDAQNSVCLEAQNLPDAINHANFPSPILRPGEVYEQTTVYQFRV